MNNREYWRERMRALEEKGYRESEAYYEELKKKFTSANNQIQMDIDRWYQACGKQQYILCLSSKVLKQIRTGRVPVECMGIYQKRKRECIKPGMDERTGKCIRKRTYQLSAEYEDSVTAARRRIIYAV